MEILLFGITKEITGKQKLSVAAENQLHTVADLKHWLGQHYPAITKLSSLAVAVNSEYADDSVAIDEQSEIALIPPVSGG